MSFEMTLGLIELRYYDLKLWYCEYIRNQSLQIEKASWKQFHSCVAHQRVHSVCPSRTWELIRAVSLKLVLVRISDQFSRAVHCARWNIGYIPVLIFFSDTMSEKSSNFVSLFELIFFVKSDRFWRLLRVWGRLRTAFITFWVVSELIAFVWALKLSLLVRFVLSIADTLLGTLRKNPWQSVYLISLLISGFGFRFTNVGRFCKARSGDWDWLKTEEFVRVSIVEFPFDVDE